MSGTTRSAIDVMTAEDTALLDSMRNETDAPEVETTDLPGPVVDEPPTPEAEDEPDAVAEAPDGQPGKPQSRYTKRVFELTEKAQKAEEARIAAEQRAAVAESVTNERLRLLTEAAQAALQPTLTAPVAPPPVEIPDINTDPVGHFKARLELADRQAAERDAILKGFAEQQQQAQQFAELKAWGSAQEAAFAAKEPSYNEAINFLLDRRKSQLAVMNVVDPVEQQKVVMSDITQIAIRSRAEGADFGERMYKLAEAYGFQKKAAAPAAPAVPAIPSIEAGLPAAERVARAEAGRANSVTIANVGASTPVSFSPEKIGNLSDAQFAKYLDSIKGDPAKLRDLMGH